MRPITSERLARFEVGFVLAAGLAAIFSPGALASESSVVVRDLGTLGGTSASAQAVNASGQVVGYSDVPGDASVHAFSWTQAAGMTDLGTLGGSHSYARAVNESGEVAGFSRAAGDSAFHPFLWGQAGGMID